MYIHHEKIYLNHSHSAFAIAGVFAG